MIHGRWCELGFAPPRRLSRYGIFHSAGMVIVADGTEEAKRRLERVLHNDPAMGVIRHADAGYDVALDTARKFRLDLEADSNKRSYATDTGVGSSPSPVLFPA